MASFSWINFSGKLQAKRREAEVALREWLVYLVERLAFSDVLVIILRKVLTPTGTFAYHGFLISTGAFGRG